MALTRTIRLVVLDQCGGVEPRRLMRSLQLRVERVERGRYRVLGGTEEHHVDLVDPRMERCDCGDHLWRGRACKHLLACLLREGDERVLRALGRLVAAMDTDLRRLRRLARGPTIVLTPALKARTALASGVPLNSLRFERDRDGERGDVNVIDALDGVLMGVLRRPHGPPEFLRSADLGQDEAREAA